MHEMLPSQLAACCQNTQPDASHEPFCFELFRRAIVEGCSVCWHYLVTQYYPLVRYWVSQCTSATPDAIDDLTQDAFIAFWRFYTPEKLSRANGLADILAYLKSCVASAVAQAQRKRVKTVPEIEWDQQIVDAYTSVQSAEASALQRVAAQRVWDIIEAHCNDEQERVVARCTFLASLQPRHIAERFPHLFPDVSDVHRVKRNLVARLRRDPVLQVICKNEQTTHLKK